MRREERTGRVVYIDRPSVSGSVVTLSFHGHATDIPIVQ